MNVADSELVATILAGAGYRLVDGPEEADVILINTCAVRENAEERVIGRAGQLHGLRARRPGLTLGILGCMAQHLAQSLPERAPWVDLIAGPDAYARLPDLLAQSADEALLDTRLSRTENYIGIDPTPDPGATNAWVTIIRGCDKFCTFCVVPYVRGRERSLEAAEVLRRVRHLAAEGFREVTLLGQTVNSYRDGSTTFGRVAAPGRRRGRHRARALHLSLSRRLRRRHHRGHGPHPRGLPLPAPARAVRLRRPARRPWTGATPSASTAASSGACAGRSRSWP